MNKKILFMLCDCPTKETGFARVARALVDRWIAANAFDEIWVWGIGYWGLPHDYPKHVKIFPAASPTDMTWYSRENLTRFASLLQASEATHLWMMHDIWAINPLAKAIETHRQKTGMKALLYFPVDAPLEPEWTTILESVDVAVAYTDYGREEAWRALCRPIGEKKRDKKRAKLCHDITILPHGVDCTAFRPLPVEERRRIRRKLFDGRVEENDFLMVNVNANQRRKGVLQSLQVLAALKTNMRSRECEMKRDRALEESGGEDVEPYIKRRPRLYLHMESVNAAEGIDLRLLARQLGLLENNDVFFGDANFIHGRPKLNDEGLNQIYNAADMYLTTTLGEGWGLGITEAMAAGLLVAGPDHTAVGDLLGFPKEIQEARGVIFPVGHEDVTVNDNNRIRPRVIVDIAAHRIADVINELSDERCVERARAWIAQPQFGWNNIATSWLALMRVEGRP